MQTNQAVTQGNEARAHAIDLTDEAFRQSKIVIAGTFALPTAAALGVAATAMQCRAWAEQAIDVGQGIVTRVLAEVAEAFAHNALHRGDLRPVPAADHADSQKAHVRS